MKEFPFYYQLDEMDCGPTCLRIIGRHYGKKFDIKYLRHLCRSEAKGSSFAEISDAAETLGFRSFGTKLTRDQLTQIKLPCISFWDQNHFAVLYKIKDNKYYVADPARGLVLLSQNEFNRGWTTNKDGLQIGIALILTPTRRLYEFSKQNDTKYYPWRDVIKYFYPYSRLFIQLGFCFLLGLIFQITMPLLTQAIVDIGIQAKDLNLLYIILAAQICLFIGQTTMEFVKSWSLMYISTQLNITMLSDVLMRLLRLPLTYFDGKTTGDLIQRMNDQQRIESFLTGKAFSTLFALVNMISFSCVLILYSPKIFLVFFISMLMHSFWILVFMKSRRRLDMQRFDTVSENQSKIIEMIEGIKDIKISNSSRLKRWGWEKLQSTLFLINAKGLALSQYQLGGGLAINQIRNIITTFICAKSVIQGDLTLGGMMSIQYIVGAVSSPIEHLLPFMQSYQDAKISLQRIEEIRNFKEEDYVEDEYTYLPVERSITIKNLSFSYKSSEPDVLANIGLIFQSEQTTAIVGLSGSGKSTLIKLLLKFYDSYSGEIIVGGVSLRQFSARYWRDMCGIVDHEGFIFADTIENNVALGDDSPDRSRVFKALKIANLTEFVTGLPLGVETKVGMGGKGISQGQKQRLLIARVVYKNPEFIFFDEATSCLDSENESIVMKNIRKHFAKKTIIIVAHRFSSIKYADKIVVFENGCLIEQGSHIDLIAKRQSYYDLVKNQMGLKI